VNSHVRLDDRPQELLVADDAPDRHQGRRWVAARLDGAAFILPARDWQEQTAPMRSDRHVQP